MQNCLNQNVYLKKGENTGVLFLNWNLNGEKPCLYNKDISQNIRLTENSANIEDIILSTKSNLEETQKDSFIENMIQYLEYRLAKIENNKRIVVNIHRKGDFYSVDYLIKWVYISEHFKGNDKIVFEAYIKSLTIITDYINEYVMNYGDDLLPEEIIDDINISFKYDLVAEIE